MYEQNNNEITIIRDSLGLYHFMLQTNDLILMPISLMSFLVLKSSILPSLKTIFTLPTYRSHDWLLLSMLHQNLLSAFTKQGAVLLSIVKKAFNGFLAKSRVSTLQVAGRFCSPDNRSAVLNGQLSE